MQVCKTGKLGSDTDVYQYNIHINILYFTKHVPTLLSSWSKL